MSAQLIRFLSEDITHAMHPTLDYTLCGATMDGDPETMGDFLEVEGRRLTCPQCIDVVQFGRECGLICVTNKDPK